MKLPTKSTRNHLFASRVKKEWLAQLKKIAYEEDIKYVEVLERSLDFYASRREKKKLKQ